MADLSILTHTSPDEDLQPVPGLAEIVSERFDEVPHIGDRIYDPNHYTHKQEWVVYDRGFYPREDGGSITLTLCPVGADPYYFQRNCNPHLYQDE
jgi:hypothetical protein